ADRAARLGATRPALPRARRPGGGDAGESAVPGRRRGGRGGGRTAAGLAARRCAALLGSPAGGGGLDAWNWGSPSLPGGSSPGAALTDLAAWAQARPSLPRARGPGGGERWEKRLARPPPRWSSRGR